MKHRPIRWIVLTIMIHWSRRMKKQADFLDNRDLYHRAARAERDAQVMRDHLYHRHVSIKKPDA